MSLTDRIAAMTALDAAAARARDVVARVVTNRRIKDALHGVWLGHPLHPALAQLTLGSFTSAAILDAVAGDRRASTTLIAVGVVASVPTVASGWADYGDAHEDQQRVGLVHAGLNAASVTAFLAVLALRARGGSARGLSAAAGTLAGVAAALGGDLAYRRALGANHAEQVPHVGPSRWTTLGALDTIDEHEPTRRTAGDLPVVVVRDGATVHVLSDSCPHLAAPMSEGELDDGTLTCPWHGSVFRVEDGSVVHGPATAPLPCLESRIVDGSVEVRIREV